MKRALAAEVDNLYRLPLAEFTNARNTLAKTLSGSEKKEIASLVKPSLPMWVVNQLYWQDAPTYNALVDAAETLRAAHRAMLSGRKADTRQPDQLHRTTVEKAFSKSIAIADKSGVRLTDAVRDTVRRTLAALPGEEPAGHLTRPPEPAGFSLLTDIKPRPQAARPVRPAADAAERKSSKRDDLINQKRIEREQKEAERRARKEADAARRAQEKAKKEQEKREREIRKAELKR